MAQKTIKILYNGPIYAKGGVYGPILTPYAEETSVISNMLISRIKVVEVLPNGELVELNLSNFDKDNAKKVAKEEKKVEVPVSANQAQAQAPQQQNKYQDKNNFNKNQKQAATKQHQDAQKQAPEDKKNEVTIDTLEEK